MISLIAVLALAAGSYAGPSCPGYQLDAHVCGYDLKTYPSKCHAGSTPILHSGICQPLITTICGSDGVFYPNIAFFNREARENPNLSIDYSREGCSYSDSIEDDEGCTMVYRPVCGPDEQTYINLCHYWKAPNPPGFPSPKLPHVHNGECGYILCNGQTFYDLPAFEAANLTHTMPFIMCVPFHPPLANKREFIVTPA